MGAFDLFLLAAVAFPGSAAPAAASPLDISGDTVSAAPASTAPAATAPEDTAPEATAPAVTVGTGTLLVNGFVQTWYSSASGTQGSFRVRAAELTFSGQVTPRASWRIKVDVAKGLSLQSNHQDVDGVTVVTGSRVNQRGRILQDAFVTLALPGDLSLVAGQGKLPLGLDHGYAPSALPAVTRARFLSDGARGGLGVVRDVGVSLAGSIGTPVRWQVGVWNGMGEGMNQASGDGRRAAAARVTAVTPGIPTLTLGVTGAHDLDQPEGMATRHVAGADARWRHDGWTVMSEMVAIRHADARRLGWYVHADRRLAMELRPFVRLEGWDPDTRRSGAAPVARETRWTAGASHYFAGENVKLEAAVSHATLAGDLPSSTSLILNLQLAW